MPQVFLSGRTDQRIVGRWGVMHSGVNVDLPFTYNRWRTVFLLQNINTNGFSHTQQFWSSSDRETTAAGRRPTTKTRSSNTNWVGFQVYGFRHTALKDLPPKDSRTLIRGDGETLSMEMSFNLLDCTENRFPHKQNEKKLHVSNKTHFWTKTLEDFFKRHYFHNRPFREMKTKEI